MLHFKRLRLLVLTLLFFGLYFFPAYAQQQSSGYKPTRVDSVWSYLQQQEERISVDSFERVMYKAWNKTHL